MTSVAPTTSLIGCKVNWEPYESAVIQAVLDGKKIESELDVQKEKNDAWGGLADNWVQMLELNEVNAAPGTRKAVKRAIDGFAKGQIKVFYGKYTGVNPLNPSDKIDLTKEYQENAKASAPGFCYQLDDIVTVKEMDTQQ